DGVDSVADGTKAVELLVIFGRDDGRSKPCSGWRDTGDENVETIGIGREPLAEDLLVRPHERAVLETRVPDTDPADAGRVHRDDPPVMRMALSKRVVPPAVEPRR